MQTHDLREQTSEQLVLIGEMLPPDAGALQASIRRLWARERQLGYHTPGSELDLRLASLSVNQLQQVRRQVRARIARYTAQHALRSAA